tara:strand:+ start:2430 stop:3014 length:585 start_codon:yes stop_codon:yes gene_type:complete
MATQVLYISENRLKESTTISNNVDTELLVPNIKIAQDKYILTKLGSKLDDKLQKLIQDDQLDDVGNENYKKLVNIYIQPSLIQWTLYESIIFLGFKFQNKDIMRKNSETGSPASLDDLKFLREEVRNTSEWYTERLVDYLCHNNNLFPEYSQNTNEDVRPSKHNYFNGMNLELMPKKRIGNVTLNDFLDSNLSQ